MQQEKDTFVFWRRESSGEIVSGNSLRFTTMQQWRNVFSAFLVYFFSFQENFFPDNAVLVQYERAQLFKVPVKLDFFFNTEGKLCRFSSNDTTPDSLLGEQIRGLIPLAAQSSSFKLKPW